MILRPQASGHAYKQNGRSKPFTAERTLVPVEFRAKVTGVSSASEASSGFVCSSAARDSVIAAAGAPAHAHGPRRTLGASCSGSGSRRGGVAAAAGAPNLDALFADLDVPQIDGDIRSLQVEMGAIFDDAGVATTFGKKRQALQALESGVVLCDQSHWGRLRVAGEGRTALLHNQSTADFKALRPGQGTDTVFTTATGRCLDLATALVLPSSVLLLLGPGQEGKDELAARLDKYIFPADKVTVQDISAQTAQLALMGPEAEVLLRELAPPGSPDALAPLLAAAAAAPHPATAHVLLGFRGKPVFLAAGSGLGPEVPGFRLVADEAVAGDIYAAFAAKGAIPMGSEDWEAARVLAGRPTRGSELTQDYNPLEAGLYGAVSLNKGCYIGQETLAKLHLREGVRRQLWGLRLAGPTQPGAAISSELSQVGTVTSACQDGDGEWVGLGFIRSRVEGTQLQLEGVRVAVAGQPALVAAIPFATRTLSAAAEAPKPAAEAEEAEGDADSMADRLAEAKRKKAEAAAAKEAATQAKLQAMQERLAAWQAQQQAAAAAQQQQE